VRSFRDGVLGTVFEVDEQGGARWLRRDGGGDAAGAGEGVRAMSDERIRYKGGDGTEGYVEKGLKNPLDELLIDWRSLDALGARRRGCNACGGRDC
jgi:hypothetical protein